LGPTRTTPVDAADLWRRCHQLGWSWVSVVAAAVDTNLQPCYVVMLLPGDTVWRVRQTMSRVGWRQDGGTHACRLIS
jgi:hypothetical protein